MFTQCPECEEAFRVTADVLKQAAGKVRCGGCGIAFNALAHLSEDMPDAAAGSSANDAAEPAAPDEPPELEAGSPPQAISAEQSAALLKTLDQLAGEDIRIEDTGVEWRVIDADEDEEDEALADDPVPSAVHEEMRFDDNTPLPDDFDLDTPTPPPPPPEPEPEPEPEEDDELEGSQVDLVFGEPDEWEDLLGDLDEAVEAVIDDQADIEEQPEEAVSEKLEASIEEQLEQEFAEELEKELDKERAEEPDEEPAEDLPEEDLPEEDLRETSIEEDLIAAAFEVEAAARAKAETEVTDDGDEINLDDVNPEDLSRAGILDEDDYLKVITEDDEDEVLDEIYVEDSEQDQKLARAVLEDEAAAEAVAEVLEQDEPEAELDDDTPDEDLEEELDEALDEGLEEELDEALDEELEEDLEQELEAAVEGLLDDDVEDEAEAEAIEYAEPIDIEVPEPTEEEKTVNMMIDQDLLAIAEEDEDGFTSTIVQKQVSDKDDIPVDSAKDEAREDENEDEDVAADDSDQDVEESAETDADDAVPAAIAANADGNPLMETIIMEGETVLNEQDEERLAAARVAASESLKQAGFEEEKTSFNWRDWEPPRYSMAAAAALLAVILVVQVIHHSREALAVSPAFQNTIGPVYRMVGSPVTPAWDVKGWRFEATKGNTDESGDVLTIYSRIGNNSQQTLPYPLVHVSLTDRFEEIIGSRVLEPTDYLVEDADPSVAIQPGETFNAVIAINSPSAAATSFKLNVCYRLASGQLRCADKDFR